MIRGEGEVILLIIRYLRSKKKNSKTFSWELAVDNGKKNRKLTVLLRTSALKVPGCHRRLTFSFGRLGKLTFFI